MRHSDILQGPIQRDHITGHQVELIDLELLLLLLLLVGRDGDRLAQLPGHPLVLGHYAGLGPAAQQLPGIAAVTPTFFVRRRRQLHLFGKFDGALLAVLIV